MAPPPPPALMNDVIGEILVRLPPADPSCLFRASLVCKPWRGLLLDRVFLRRYRAFHRTPPMLGFFHDLHSNGAFIPRFVPVTGAHPVPQPARGPRCGSGCWTLDCRHGRVLLHNLATSGLVVWDPITGGHQDIPQPVNEYDEESEFFTAAVLCASDGCDHLECRGGPYLVVFAGGDFGEDDDFVAWVSVYSSEAGAWSAVVSVHPGPILDSGEVMGRSLLAGDALCFTFEEGQRILKFDLVGCVLSVIRPPAMLAGNMVLVTAEDGGLGVAGVKNYSLHLWSWRIGIDSIGEWVQGRVIELDMMITISIGDPTTKLDIVGFAEGAGSIFIRGNDGLFAVESKSGRVRKIGKRGDFSAIFPFMSFYTPDRASATLQALMRTE